MQLTIDLFKEETGSLHLIVYVYVWYMLHQAQENYLKLKNSQPCKKQKTKNIL